MLLFELVELLSPGIGASNILFVIADNGGPSTFEEE